MSKSTFLAKLPKPTYSLIYRYFPHLLKSQRIE